MPLGSGLVPRGSRTSLEGYFLTDDMSQPDKWMFPDLEISDEGHILIWADEDQEDGPLHTNFKLSSSGEYIAVFDPYLNLIDEISFDVQSDDISYGRSFDDPEEWQFFEIPTPGASNIEENWCGFGNFFLVEQLKFHYHLHSYHM